MTNAELIDLLRVARGFMLCTCGECVKHGDLIDEVVIDARSIVFAQWSPEQHEAEAVRDRIDAALAERQDSATDVVESDEAVWTFQPQTREETALINGKTLAVYPESRGWRWIVVHAGLDGLERTESAAKSAAIAAARGMR